MNTSTFRIGQILLLFLLTSFTLSAQDSVFKVVEEMPRFPGCEEVEDLQERSNCAQGNMLEFIYKNLVYPESARTKKVEGMAIVQFIVDLDGSVIEPNLIRDPGEGCGEAALAVVKAMNEMEDKWTPGKQRGQAVKVMYTLPVKFKLEK